MHVVESFVPRGDSAIPMQPREGAFDDPARAPVTTAMAAIAPRDERTDSPPAQLLSMADRIVAAIALHDAQFVHRCARASAHRGTASTNGSSSVMSGQLAALSRATSGMPFASVRRWCLLPALRRSVGFGPVVSPAQRADGGTVDHPAREIELAAPSQFGEQHLVHALPDARALPGDEASPTDRPGSAAHLPRQHIPWDAAAQDEQDAAQYRAVRNGRPAGVSVVPWRA